MEITEPLPVEKRAAYYENIIIEIIESVLKHGHWADPLSRSIADKLGCLDRLPEDYSPKGT